MTNTQLKNTIEAAGYEVDVRSYKNGSLWEAQAEAYTVGSGYRIGGTGKARHRPADRKLAGAAYGGRTNFAARRYALLQLADKAGIAVSEEDKAANHNAADADFAARTM